MEPTVGMERPNESEKKHIFDDPRNIKRLIRVFFVVCAVMIALDLVVHRHLSFKDGVFPAEAWFGYYAVYGWVACVILVLVAKQMRKVLMRDEDHYDE
jgi:hypothetical protein